MKPTEFIKRILNFISVCGDNCDVLLGNNKDPNQEITIYQDEKGNLVITDDIIQYNLMPMNSDMQKTIEDLVKYVENLQIEQQNIKDDTLRIKNNEKL